MKKNKFNIYITITLMCTLLVSVILMRFKTVEETDLQEESAIRETELRKEISTLKGQYEQIEQMIENTNQKINEYQDQIEKNTDSSMLVDNELKQTDEILGKTDVRGDGVFIILTDNENEKILATDLSEIINELRYAGSEAISINNIRITALTDITEATSDLILINGQRITSPYEVKAIGNQTYLYSTLSAKNGFIDYYTNQYGINIKIEKQRNIIINKTNEDFEYKYIKEGEE